MPKGKPRCPVCQGKGTITEDTREYEFITRDPKTSRCLICAGTGVLNPSTKLPNGKRAFEVFRKENGTQMTQMEGIDADKELDSSLRWNDGNDQKGKRLNVSKKAVVKGIFGEVEDTGLGYEPDPRIVEIEREKELRLKPVELPAKASVTEMRVNPRLDKVLASGKEFLIVTETEPYYLVVYALIRREELQNGTWTWEDEDRFVDAMMREKDSLVERLKEYEVTQGRLPALRKEVSNG